MKSEILWKISVALFNISSLLVDLGLKIGKAHIAVREKALKEFEKELSLN